MADFVVELAERITLSTNEGPATQWNDRIADIAKQAGLPLQNINWIGTPSSIALRVAEYAKNYDGPPLEWLKNKYGV